MTTIGYGDKTPHTIAGRILALIWMVLAMGVTAMLTAALTSVLALQGSSGKPQKLSSLRDQKVLALQGSAATRVLKHESISFETLDSSTKALRRVEDGSIDVFVAPKATAQYWKNKVGIAEVVVEALADGQSATYAFALPENSSLRESVTHAVLQVTTSADWKRVLSRYIKAESTPR